MIKSEYHISKMDCPSEENMIRMKLDGIEVIRKLEFDIENRNLTVFHSREDEEINIASGIIKLWSKTYIFKFY